MVWFGVFLTQCSQLDKNKLTFVFPMDLKHSNGEKVQDKNTVEEMFVKVLQTFIKQDKSLIRVHLRIDALRYTRGQYEGVHSTCTRYSKFFHIFEKNVKSALVTSLFTLSVMVL